MQDNSVSWKNISKFQVKRTLKEYIPKKMSCPFRAILEL